MKTLEELSDQELSEAFAVEVAGMPEAQFKVQSAFGQQTHFATDANAVLPFVQAHDIVCHFVPSNGLWHMRVCFSTPMVFAEAPTFARAACIALLKAQRDAP